MRKLLAITASLLLAACATVQPATTAPVTVKIIGFNDFHGALEPPRQAVTATAPGGGEVRVPAGGAAYLASAVRSLRAQNPNTLVVAAGDLISASPLVSAQFLDEPSIMALNMIGVDFSALGNHEFDRGRQELLRIQNGGCARHTQRDPCRVDPDFPGARFRYLAANVRTEDGRTLLPAYGIRTFGSGASQVKIAVIGLPLRETATLVTPAGVAGLTFGDEADAINALIPRLRAEGADAIVVAIHQGLSTTVGFNDQSCAGIDGDLLPVLARLDPAVDLVVSGHTHNAYICDYGRIDPARPFLVTSAGRNGTLLTDITLTIDPARNRVLAKRADNLIVQSEAYQGSSGPVPVSDRFPRYQPDPAVAALVARYAEAAGPLANRVVGRLSAPALREAAPSGESVLGNLIADAHLAATRAPENGGAQVAFTNHPSVRADIVPAADGSVTFGQLFTAQPFGNTLMVKTMAGRQLRAVLEQQFDSGSNSVTRPVMLLPSRGFSYSYDLTRPAGQRILDLKLNGQPIADETSYRVTMNSFLATGGDNFTLFREGTNPFGGPLDLEAVEAYLMANDPLTPPAADRVTRLSPP